MSPVTELYKAFINGAAICTDSRKITDGCIFFALKGPSFDGNRFVKEALEKGAAWAVADDTGINESKQIVVVDDVLECLQQLANHHRRQFNIPVVAITGSNGKTTTKELINRVLSKKYRALCTQGNLNNHIGVPLTMLSLTSQHQIAIIEMGANHRGEIALLCKITEPTHVLITNVGKAHLEGFGGFEGVKAGKGEMYDFARSHNATVFINQDNPHLIEMAAGTTGIYSYGTTGTEDIIGENLKADRHVALRWRKNKSAITHEIHSHITGSYNFENILAAVAIGDFFSVDADDIRSAVESYVPDNQRSQEVVIGSTMVILDAYNANPTSMHAALMNFSNTTKGPRAVFLGEMLELGDESAAEHQKIVDELQQVTLNEVLLVGMNFMNTKGLEHARRFADSESAKAWVAKNNFENYSILIKGSRGSRMEKLLEGLSLKAV